MEFDPVTARFTVTACPVCQSTRFQHQFNVESYDRERTPMGTTNIQFWSRDWLLLRMVLFAARKLKFV